MIYYCSMAKRKNPKVKTRLRSGGQEEFAYTNMVSIAAQINNLTDEFIYIAGYLLFSYLKDYLLDFIMEDIDIELFYDEENSIIALSVFINVDEDIDKSFIASALEMPESLAAKIQLVAHNNYSIPIGYTGIQLIEEQRRATRI